MDTEAKTAAIAKDGIRIENLQSCENLTYFSHKRVLNYFNKPLFRTFSHGKYRFLKATNNHRLAHLRLHR